MSEHVVSAISACCVMWLAGALFYLFVVGMVEPPAKTRARLFLLSPVWPLVALAVCLRAIFVSLPIAAYHAVKATWRDAFPAGEVDAESDSEMSEARAEVEKILSERP